jgi:thiamine monophosphate synthase
VIKAGATRVAISAAVIRANQPRRAVARLKAILNGDLPGQNSD